MSLGIAFKGPEGIVLAADSRVTLLAQQPGVPHVIPSTFDNATKMFYLPSFNNVGAVTYGLGAIGVASPRTAHSFMPEFEAELNGAPSVSDSLSVREFASRLSNFFLKQWQEQGMPSTESYQGDDMIFLVGGYDKGEPYGRVFEFFVPSRPEPRELNADSFGVTWGGQLQVTSRMLHGYDPALPAALAEALALGEDGMARVRPVLDSLRLPIPYQFLPLQDCVDLSILLIRTTMELQAFQVGVRGVGGAIDVATVTRTAGFRFLQEKVLRGERRDI